MKKEYSKANSLKVFTVFQNTYKEDENILCNHQKQYSKYYETYAIVRKDKEYSLKLITKQDQFSYEVTYTYSKLASEYVLKNFLQCYTRELSFSIKSKTECSERNNIKKLCKKYNIITKKFISKANNYRIAENNYLCYTACDTEYEILGCTYFNTKKDADTIANAINRYEQYDDIYK